MISLLSYLCNGISLGSVYAIIALGYTMVYGIAKMLHFAHGDVIMIGAYVTFGAIQYLSLIHILSATRCTGSATAFPAGRCWAATATPPQGAASACWPSARADWTWRWPWAAGRIISPEMCIRDRLYTIHVPFNGEGQNTSEATCMMNLTQKILASHLVSGQLIPGEEISIRIDQTLTQDSTGTMAYLQFEAMGVKRVRTKRSVAYIDPVSSTHLMARPMCLSARRTAAIRSVRWKPG